MALRDGLKPTGRKGVFFKEHESRKHGVRKDRLLVLRYTIGGKTKTEAFGWTSQADSTGKPNTEINAELKLATFRANAKSGVGPTSMAEERDTLEAERITQVGAERDALEEAEAVAVEERRKNTPVEEFFAEVYLPQAKHDKKPDSWRTEERLFRHWIAPVIGHLSFEQISIEHLNTIKQNMAAGKRGEVLPHPRDKKAAKAERNPARPMSARSQHYALAVVRQLWNLACAIKPPLAAGSWPGLSRQSKKPKIENKRQRFLTGEEAAVLLGRLRKSSKNVHDMALLALHCGMRAGEILNLPWNRVNMAKGELLLLDTKNGESRTAYLTDQALAMLRERAVDRDPGRHVFVNAKGGPFHQVPVTFARAVAALGLNEGVEDSRDKVVFHSLRHTYASWMVEHGANIKLVGDLLGHKTLIMTTRYTHTTADAQREAVAVLSKRLAPSGDKVVSIAGRKKA